jgi:hypothetical protein
MKFCHIMHSNPRLVKSDPEVVQVGVMVGLIGLMPPHPPNGGSGWLCAGVIAPSARAPSANMILCAVIDGLSRIALAAREQL